MLLVSCDVCVHSIHALQPFSKMASNGSSTVSSKLGGTELSILSDKHLLFKLNQHSWTLMFGLRMKMSLYLAFSLCCCRRSLSCQMNRVPGLFRSSMLGLEGDRGEEEADDGGPTSTWRLDLERKKNEKESFVFFLSFPHFKLEKPVFLYCSPHYCKLHCWPQEGVEI